MHPPSKFCQLGVHQLDDLKAVEDVFRLRKAFQYRLVVRTGYVRRNGLDFRVRAVNPFPKGFERVFALSVPHKDNRARLPIDDDREKLMPSSNVDFIDRDNLQITQTWFPKILLEVFLVDAANHGFAHSKIPGHILDCHHLP